MTTAYIRALDHGTPETQGEPSAEALEATYRFLSETLRFAEDMDVLDDVLDELSREQRGEPCEPTETPMRS